MSWSRRTIIPTYQSAGPIWSMTGFALNKKVCATTAASNKCRFISLLSEPLSEKNQGRLRPHCSHRPFESTESPLIDDAIPTGNGIFPFWDAYLLLGGVGIKHYYDITPRVRPGMVFQTESHHPLRCLEKGKMMAHQFCRAEPKGRMMVPQGDQMTIIIRHLW